MRNLRKFCFKSELFYKLVGREITCVLVCKLLRKIKISRVVIRKAFFFVGPCSRKRLISSRYTELLATSVATGSGRQASINRANFQSAPILDKISRILSDFLPLE